MSVYITSVSGGNCVTKNNNTLVNKKPTKDVTQLWTIEKKEGSNDQIAIRCNADGKYLRAKSGNGYGAVETGEKQWWQLEDGQAHGSYWMKCLDFPNAYLCNANGSFVENNKIYMWPRQEGWTHALTFYLHDANAAGYLSQAEQDDGSSSPEAAKRMEDVKKREEALAEKEAEVAKVAKLSEEAKKMMDEAKKKEAALAEKEAQIGKAAKPSDTSSKESKDLEEKERALAARESDYQARIKALEEREKATSGNEASGVGDEDAKARKEELEALSRERKEVAKKFAELEAREKEFAQSEKQVAKGTDEDGSPDGSDLAEENERLAEELAEARRELANLTKGSLVYKIGARGRAVPPPSNMLPERKRPDAKPPAPSIPSTYNSDLLKRFEAGRTAMKA